MSLRQAAMRGGTYLAGRQAASLAIHLTGVLFLTRLIGPASYGVYAAALGMYTFLYTVTQSGVNVYLIRREGELTPEDHAQAFTLLLAIGAAAALTAMLATPFLQRWTRIDDFAPVARTMFAVLPLQLLSLVPSALLERALDYRRVARCEVTGQAACYLVALPLALGGAGPWAPVAGYWTQQVTLFALLIATTRYRPRLVWRGALVREMVAYGWTFSSVTWAWQLRELVPPLIVGRFAGAAAVGYVALTARLVDALSFMKTVAWRLSIGILAPLQHDRRRLVIAVTEGMRLQALALGPILVAFGLAAPLVMREMFGDRWVFVAQLYPYIALSYLTNAVFLLHTSALCLVRRPSRPVVFGLVHVALFAGTALLFVPRVGVVGYGWAELAALSSYAVLHAFMSREIDSPAYGLTAVWWVASASALFWQQIGWWSALAPVVALAWPGTVREFRRYALNVAGVLHAR